MRQVVSRPAIVVITLLLVGTSGVLADVRLPAVIADNMVLQQGMKAPVWGWAEADKHAPGFPDDGQWTVEYEGLKEMP